MRPLEAKEGREAVKGSLTMWRPWQIKQLEIFQAIAFSNPPCQQLTQEYRLACNLSGIAHYRYRNTRGQISNGTFYVIEPGETLSYQPKDSTYHILFIDSSWLQQFATEQLHWEKSLPHFPIHGLFDPSLSRALRDLAARSLDPASRLQQEETLLSLLAPLLLSHAQDARALSQLGREHQAIKQIKEYLEAHYAEEVELQELARVVNLSPFHLSRLFRLTVGLPPHAYQTQLRLARAKTLLAQDYDVSQVAHETGFFDQSHFTQQFKRHYLVTPGSYRKSARFS